MSLSKTKPKTRKGAVKRIKVSKGSSTTSGKLQVNRINDNHRLIRKPRRRKLKAKRSTVVSKGWDKFRKVI
jgi:ribosomal protein L35